MGHWNTSILSGFNTQPPEGGWQQFKFGDLVQHVSTHSRLKAAGILKPKVDKYGNVSTHSRLKAAGHQSTFAVGKKMFQHTAA